MLDFRVFVVTVFLSFVLITVAIADLLCMFGIYKNEADAKQRELVVFYALTESLPIVLIACYLSTNIASDDGASDHYQAVSHSPIKQSKLNAESESEDSEFGNFNPNLHHRKDSVDHRSDNNSDRKSLLAVPRQTSSFAEPRKPLFPLNAMKIGQDKTSESDYSGLQNWDAQTKVNNEGPTLSNSDPDASSHSSGSESSY